VTVWSGLAVIFSDELAALLPPDWVGNSESLSFTGKAAIVAASVAVLVHARPLWVGLEDQGFVGAELTRSATAAPWQQAGSWFSADPQSRVARATTGRSAYATLGIIGLGVFALVFRSILLHHTAGQPIASPQTFAAGEAEAWRMHNGGFVFRAIVNDQPVPMMFDTGASFVALRAEDAPRLGINMASLAYDLRMSTANGVASAAKVTIATMTVGAITMHDVPAIVAQPGMLQVNLLGQTFLTRLRNVQVEGNRVTLYGD